MRFRVEYKRKADVFTFLAGRDELHGNEIDVRVDRNSLTPKFQPYQLILQFRYNYKKSHLSWWLL